MSEQTEPVRVHDVAPMPYDHDEWTAENLIRHYAARAASLSEATHQTVLAMPSDPTSPAFRRNAMQTARLSEAANAHLAVATLLHIIATRTAGIHGLVEETLTELLNGEWVDQAYGLLGRYGVKVDLMAPEPCDLDDHSLSS